MYNTVAFECEICIFAEEHNDAPDHPRSNFTAELTLFFRTPIAILHIIPVYHQQIFF